MTINADSILASITAVALFVWFLLSVLNQFDSRWVQYVAAKDRWRLLPRWTFFAPTPGTIDFHVVVREMRKDGSITSWSEVVLYEHRRPFNAIWHPRKRFMKLLYDCVVWLAILNRTQPPTRLRRSTPYRILLQCACSVASTSDITARQFGVVGTTGHGSWRKPELLIVSFLETAPL